MAKPATQSVFELLDPATGKLGYIGVSSDPKRYASRLYARARSCTPKSKNDGAKGMELTRWLADLSAPPLVCVIESDLAPAQARTRRQELIAKLMPDNNTYLRPDLRGATR